MSDANFYEVTINVNAACNSFTLIICCGFKSVQNRDPVLLDSFRQHRVYSIAMVQMPFSQIQQAPGHDSRKVQDFSPECVRKI